jgi:hypothetical protein
MSKSDTGRRSVLSVGAAATLFALFAGSEAMAQAIPM